MRTDSVVKPDLNTARRHIKLLTGSPDTKMHFRFVDDNQTRKKQLDRHNFGPCAVDQLWPTIEEYQADGFAVFIVVNEGGHKAADITRIRALFIDVDGARALSETKFHLEPTTIVKRSDHRWHAYWRVDGAVPLEVFKQAQLQLAAFYQSDTAVADLPRLMRLGGTIHRKVTKGANDERIVSPPTLITLEEGSGEVCEWYEVAAGLPDVPSEPQRSSVTGDFKVLPLAELRDWLAALSPFTTAPDHKQKLGRDTWRDILIGIPQCGACPVMDAEGNALGEDALDELARSWSRGDILRADGKRWEDPHGVKADDGVVDEILRTMPPRGKGKGPGPGTIFKLACKAGYKPPRSSATETWGDAVKAGSPDDDASEWFELNEDGIIRAFTQRHRGELAFDHAVGSWYRFDGNYWRREETKLAHHYARMVSTELAGDDAKAKALKRVTSWEAIERGARTVREFSVTAGHWNRDKMLLGTPGGTIDLRTGELRAGCPEDYISRITAVEPIPLDRFKAELHCPRWMMFLREALNGDTEAIRFLQQWVGYALTGETKEQCFVFVYGPGGSGKGTAFNTIGELLGDYALNMDMQTLVASKYDRHPTELARLHGARFVRASETEHGRAWNENLIKTLTGQDTITARYMRRDFFEFVPEFKMTIFGNNAPTLRNPDEAMKRRLIVLPFDHPPAFKDANLSAHLKAEWRGILSWMIDGCLDWQARGLIRPAVAVKATEGYFNSQDVLGQFLEDQCELGEDCAVTIKELWARWESYARTMRADPGTRDRTFPERLKQRGFEAIRDTCGIRGRGWKGLRLKRQDDGIPDNGGDDW
jgi:P4 family phage/plasmid primase-like protien